MIFYSIVVNAVLSGLEAFILTDSEVGRLQAFLIKKIRGLMKGKATQRGEEGEVIKTITNLEVLKWAGMATVDIELQTRRLKMWQSMT